MKTVTVYSITPCPYCDLAKNLLSSQKIPFQEIKVDRSDNEAVTALRERTKMRTFPQILFGEMVIGGYTDLAKLDAEGKLFDSLK